MRAVTNWSTHALPRPAHHRPFRCLRINRYRRSSLFGSISPDDRSFPRHRLRLIDGRQRDTGVPDSRITPHSMAIYLTSGLPKDSDRLSRNDVKHGGNRHRPFADSGQTGILDISAILDDHEHTSERAIVYASETRAAAATTF